MSIVIPTYNRRDRLHRVLVALSDQDFSGRFETPDPGWTYVVRRSRR